MVEIFTTDGDNSSANFENVSGKPCELDDGVIKIKNINILKKQKIFFKNIVIIFFNYFPLLLSKYLKKSLSGDKINVGSSSPPVKAFLYASIDL